MSLHSGQQVSAYRLTHLLAQGSMADAYLGEHVRTGAGAVVKLFRNRLRDGQEQIFLREAQRLARITHPHIVSILDFGLSGEVPFLVLDWMPGSASLRQVYPPGAQLPLTVIMSHVKQVGGALQYAHEQGMVHGDLRPEHLFLCQGRGVVLSDLGLVSIAWANGLMVGSADSNASPYAAPEQGWGELLSVSDQYALARIIYEWLSGEAPAAGSLPSLQTKAPGLPAMVEPVLRMALATEPGQRFGDMQAFVTVLEQADGSTLARPVQALQSALAPTPLTPTPAPAAQWENLLQEPLLPSQEQVDSQQAVGGAPQADISQFQPPATSGGLSRRALLIGAGAGVVGLAALGVGAAVLLKVRGSSLLPPTLVSTYSGYTASSRDEISWSPDGTRVLIVTEFDGLYLFDALTGKQLLSWSPTDHQVSSWGVGRVQNKLSIAWTKNTDQDPAIHITEAISGKEMSTYTGYPPLDGSMGMVVWKIVWSPDGSRIASIGGDGNDTDGVIRIWNPLTAQDIVKFKGPVVGDPTDVNDVVSSYQGNALWSPGGRRLLTWGFNGVLRVWDPQSGQEIASYRKHYDDHVNEASNPQVFLPIARWSPDGQWVASNAYGQQRNDATIHVWNAATGLVATVYNGHAGEKGIWKLEWSPDSRMIASLGDAGLIHVWEATGGTQLFVHRDAPDSGLAWRPGSARIASSGSDGSGALSFSVWDARNGGNVVSYGNGSGPGTPTPTLDSSGNETTYEGAETLVYSPNGQYIAALDNETTSIWEGGW